MVNSESEVVEAALKLRAENLDALGRHQEATLVRELVPLSGQTPKGRLRSGGAAAKPTVPLDKSKLRKSQPHSLGTIGESSAGLPSTRGHKTPKQPPILKPRGLQGRIIVVTLPNNEERKIILKAGELRRSFVVRRFSFNGEATTFRIKLDNRVRLSYLNPFGATRVAKNSVKAKKPERLADPND